MGVGELRSFAQHPNKGTTDTLDLHVQGWYQIGVAGVLGVKPCFSVLSNEGLDGRFFVNQGCHDIAIPRDDCVLQQDDIAIEDLATDHGVSLHSKREGSRSVSDPAKCGIQGQTLVEFR
jgi:hypothetical protein